MLEYFPFYLGIVMAIVLLVILAKKIKVAYPILLVLAGLTIGFTPGVPVVHIDPALIFVIFLPPLLYEASWAISWKQLLRFRRVICSFAFIVVFLTAMSVAFVANHFIPGFSLAMGFLLGAIVSPPDAVSAGAILQFVKVPKTMSAILEGESLLNDASSLIIFRFALIAVATGQFIWYQAAFSFGWMLIGGVGIGLIIGWIFLQIHERLPTDANTDIILTLIAPYVMYITGEAVHSSGILAVVTGGLFLSSKRQIILSSTSRIRGVNVWQSLSFVLNGLIFMLIGLALPDIAAGLDGVSITSAIGYGAGITFVLIVFRILSAYAGVYVTQIAKHFVSVADDRNPGYKIPLVFGWTGMRGVISLAAALSIPVQLSNGTAFPQRNLILFITFTVILLTLMLQGLTLPYLIRKIRLPDMDAIMTEEETYSLIQKQLAAFSLAHLKTQYSEQLKDQVVLQQIAKKWQNVSDSTNDLFVTNEYKVIYTDILNQQRNWLLKKNAEDKLMDEDIIRKHLLNIDIEEEKLKFV